MAHPTIDIVSSPDSNCPQPAYNCVEYCLQANNYIQTIGSKAQFIIEVPFGTTSYLTGLNVVIAGQTFVTAPLNAYNSIKTTGPQTQLEFAQNFKEALEANFELFDKFEFKISGTQLIADARQEGIIDDFTFDYSALVPSPSVSETQGTETTYRPNFRLILEVWECNELNEAVKKISSEAYIPDDDGALCLNVGEKIAPLLKTRVVFDENLFTGWYSDGQIIGFYCLRYGEAYADTIGDCEVILRDFEQSETIRVINSAFQRGEATDKIQSMCEGQWMTNMPQYTQVCETTDVILWVNLFDIFISPAVPPDTNLHPFIEYTYTDGSTSNAIMNNFVFDPNAPEKVFAVVFSATNINFFADPLKTIDSFECSVIFKPSDNKYASQFFKRVSCCKGDIQFYFLNEFGGYDTILFNQIQGIDIEQETSIFEGFLDCDDSALRGGKDIINQRAGDIYTITSKFIDNYQTRRWIREFLTSPLKYVRMTVEDSEDEILSKIIQLNNSVRYYSDEDNFLIVTVEFSLNEDINLQKN